MTNPFDQCAEDYDAHRPDYPQALYNAFLRRTRPDKTDLIGDCGAGTGKASSHLRAGGYRVLCIEPSLSMARQGRRTFPPPNYVSAEAEALPFRSGAMHAVIAGQCFHWFNPATALPEIARTLKPGGHFAVFWNNRDVARPAAEFFEELVLQFNTTHVCAYRKKDYAPVLEQTGDFEVTGREEFFFTVPMTIDSWMGLARSISYIRKIGAEKMKQFESSLRRELQRYDSLDCDYRTEVWFATKRH